MTKYYRITASTPYCGEHLDDYIVTDDENELRHFAENVRGECALEWAPDFNEYEAYDYDSYEDFQDAYWAECTVRWEEITLAEFIEETR